MSLRLPPGRLGHRHTQHLRAFTLIELLVSVTIFSIVMLISTGSLLSMVEANRKAQSLKAVVNNLSFALDQMSRTLRDGRTFHCGSGDVTAMKDCPEGATLIALEKFGGRSSIATDQYIFCLGSPTTNQCDPVNGTAILRSTTGVGGPYYPITAPEVTITRLVFYVAGSAKNDGTQPRVIMILRGIAGVNARTQTEIRLQTTMAQRLLDE